MMSLSSYIKKFCTQEIFYLQKTALRVLLCICCLFSIFILTACSNESVESYSRRLQKQINDDLADSNHPLRKRVESAHVSVDSTAAYVSNFRAITKDGSHEAGFKGSNIKEIRADIVVRWDGLIHKDGETILSVVWDVSSGNAQVKKAEITRTDALINIKDPEFWIGVAGCVILLL
jgi:hypothetical protein